MTSALERHRVQVGILGVGAVTQVIHLPMFSERPDVDVVAVSDPDGLKAEALPDGSASTRRSRGVPAPCDAGSQWKNRRSAAVGNKASFASGSTRMARKGMSP